MREKKEKTYAGTSLADMAISISFLFYHQVFFFLAHSIPALRRHPQYSIDSYSVSIAGSSMMEFFPSFPSRIVSPID